MERTPVMRAHEFDLLQRIGFRALLDFARGSEQLKAVFVAWIERDLLAEPFDRQIPMPFRERLHPSLIETGHMALRLRLLDIGDHPLQISGHLGSALVAQGRVLRQRA
jgi:hypothetical protein